MFEKKWIYRSGISGWGVRLKVDLVFEMEWILHVAEEKLLNGTISDEDFGRIRSKIGEDLTRIEERLYKIECQHNLDVDVIREVLNLSKDIYETYKKAPDELKRQFLGLFWDKFLVRDRKIVEAVPSRLVKELVENKAVIIRGKMLPFPAPIITLLQDYKFLAELKIRVESIRDTQRRLGLLKKTA